MQAPRSLPRVIRLPEDVSEGRCDMVLLATVVRHFVSDLFLGMKATGCHQFRVTRNSDLFVDEEAVDDLLIALEGELSSRRFGDAVRLEVSTDCPEELSRFLIGQFGLTDNDLYVCQGPVNLGRLSAIPDLVEAPELIYPSFRPRIPELLRRSETIFEAIAEREVLLHHPYESFAPFVEMLRQAARDPQVVSIRQTLYRTGTGSAVVEALLEAATAGKDVMVVIELRARFDEAANIELATALQAAGAQVVYGVVGHKTHAKMCMIFDARSQFKAIRALGTGNYHERTARSYTDLDCSPVIRSWVKTYKKSFNKLRRWVRRASSKRCCKDLSRYIRACWNRSRLSVKKPSKVSPG